MYFYKYISNKKKAKEIHPLLASGGRIVTNDVEKTMPLNAFFASVFNRKTSNQLPELVGRVREQTRPTAIQVKIVNDLLCHLDIHKSVGPNGNHLRLLRDLVEEFPSHTSVLITQHLQDNQGVRPTHHGFRKARS